MTFGQNDGSHGASRGNGRGGTWGRASAVRGERTRTCWLHTEIFTGHFTRPEVAEGKQLPHAGEFYSVESRSLTMAVFRCLSSS